jgi:hypothetical protein
MAAHSVNPQRIANQEYNRVVRRQERRIMTHADGSTQGAAVKIRQGLSQKSLDALVDEMTAVGSTPLSDSRTIEQALVPYRAELARREAKAITTAAWISGIAIIVAAITTILAPIIAAHC